MKSILRGLYSGDIIPWERRNPQSKQQHELLRKIEDEERYFMAKMSQDDCQRLQELSHYTWNFPQPRKITFSPMRSLWECC